MAATAELARTVFLRGARVVCEGSGEGPYARFEGRIAAAHEGVLHLNLLGGRNADHLCGVGEDLGLQVVAPHGWFAARGQRIHNVVPGGITLKLTGSPSRVERREYLRVRSHLPVRWDRVREDEVEDRAASLRANRQDTGENAPLVPGIADPDAARVIAALIARVEELEDKVARLMVQSAGVKGTEDTVIDISGSGMRIITETDLRIGDTIDAMVRFEEGREVRLIGCVTRVDPPNYGRTSPSAAFRFVHIDSRDREFIIRYTFREHRRQLRESLV